MVYSKKYDVYIWHLETNKIPCLCIDQMGLKSLQHFGVLGRPLYHHIAICVYNNNRNHNCNHIIVIITEIIIKWVILPNKFLVGIMIYYPLLVSAEHLCDTDLQGLFQKLTICTEWIAMNCNYRHNVDVTSWRYEIVMSHTWRRGFADTN